MFQMEATYLAWIDLEAYRISDLANTILSEAKVSVNAGPDHSSQDDFQGFIRFNFASSKPRITEAVRRISELCEG
jgi:cystathionine beta-lyase